MNKKKARTFVCKKLLSVKRVPAGWKPRKARYYEWFLTADKGSPQPLVVYVKGFNAQVDYSYKNGYQASLGEFAGRSYLIAPLRDTLREALKDCFEFMEAHNDKRLLRIQLEEQYFAQKPTIR
jgi:hypothetical protein